MTFQSIAAFVIAVVMLLGGFAMFLAGFIKGKESVKKDGVLFFVIGIIAMIVKFIVDNFA